MSIDYNGEQRSYDPKVSAKDISEMPVVTIIPQRSENAKMDYSIEPSHYERAFNSVEENPKNRGIAQRHQEKSDNLNFAENRRSYSSPGMWYLKLTIVYLFTK